MESIPTQNISKEKGTEQMHASVTHFDLIYIIIGDVSPEVVRVCVW